MIMKEIRGCQILLRTADFLLKIFLCWYRIYHVQVNLSPGDGVSGPFFEPLTPSPGTIPGVERFGRSWAIPENAKKPEDPRKAKK